MRDAAPRYWEGFTQEETHTFIEELIKESKLLDQEKTELLQGLETIVIHTQQMICPVHTIKEIASNLIAKMVPEDKDS